jgi:hypothetical protein
MYSLIKNEKRIRWVCNGNYHRKRVLKPAIESYNGDCLFAVRGIFYKVNKTEFSIETTYRNLFHSINFSPAVVYLNGTKEWYFSGKLHRDKEPAILYSNGDCEYFHMGERHRPDGPAVIYGNKQYWFENGEFIKCIV